MTKGERIYSIITTGIVVVAQLLAWLIAIYLVLTFDGPTHLLRNWRLLVVVIVLFAAGWAWMWDEAANARNWREL